MSISEDDDTDNDDEVEEDDDEDEDRVAKTCKPCKPVGANFFWPVLIIGKITQKTVLFIMSMAHITYTIAHWVSSTVTHCL